MQVQYVHLWDANMLNIKQSVRKYSKISKNGGPLTSRRLSFERARNSFGGKIGSFLCMDFEAWERDHTMLTEFGWSCVYWPHEDKVLKVRERGHLIVHNSCMNGQYVPEHRLVICSYHLQVCRLLPATFTIRTMGLEQVSRLRSGNLEPESMI